MGLREVVGTSWKKYILYQELEEARGPAFRAAADAFIHGGGMHPPIPEELRRYRELEKRQAIRIHCALGLMSCGMVLTGLLVSDLLK
jgi:hypothetical protein